MVLLAQMPNAQQNRENGDKGILDQAQYRH